MLSFPISSQRLQLILRRRGQNPQFRGSVKLKQLPQGDAFDGAEGLAATVEEKFFRFIRAKALDHTPSILRYTLYVNRI